MREILFRGKSKTDGEWVYGGFTFDAIGNPRITQIDHREEGLIFHNVIIDTVGQYTGLKDKNGVKIFEGDIVEIEPLGYRADWEQKDSNIKYLRKVEWVIYPECARGRQDELAGFKEWRCVPFTYSYNSVEIKGNIFDNPELLEAA